MIDEPDVSVSVEDWRANGRAFVSARQALEAVLAGADPWWDVVVPAINLQLTNLGLKVVSDPSVNPELGIEVYAINHHGQAVMWFDVPVELWCWTCGETGAIELIPGHIIDCPACELSDAGDR